MRGKKRDNRDQYRRGQQKILQAHGIPLLSLLSVSLDNLSVESQTRQQVAPWPFCAIYLSVHRSAL
jgi:hypothetical protein